MQFTFGKYAYQPLCEVPASYLGLALETFTIPEPLQVAIRIELAERFGLSVHTSKHAKVEAEPKSEVKRIYRQLAVKYHPDKGGSHVAMQAVNEFYEALSAL
ncbi:J domain-containing protein [Fibrisoma montanum]|uniref:J domain-containing protein n=1 Tax=Fibrisoma montanum TaxID=2305895 RepID=A0A418M3P3_9BACT|nr:J domain-containing protein [Fibrisoma montanum]RIV20388.1 J domain-containing protein [Fibrisoma montanum]